MFILVTAKWQSFVESAKHDNDWFPPTSAGLLLKEMVLFLNLHYLFIDCNLMFCLLLLITLNQLLLYVHLSTHKSGNEYCMFLFKMDPNGKMLSAMPFSSYGFLAADGWQIHMLDYILKVADRDTSEGQKEVRVARILLYKVFYDQTENGILPFIFRLIKTFDVQKQPRRHAPLPLSNPLDAYTIKSVNEKFGLGNTDL